MLCSALRSIIKYFLQYDFFLCKCKVVNLNTVVLPFLLCGSIPHLVYTPGVTSPLESVTLCPFFSNLLTTGRIYELTKTLGRTFDCIIQRLVIKNEMEFHGNLTGILYNIVVLYEVQVILKIICISSSNIFYIQNVSIKEREREREI